MLERNFVTFVSVSLCMDNVWENAREKQTEKWKETQRCREEDGWVKGRGCEGEKEGRRREKENRAAVCDKNTVTKKQLEEEGLIWLAHPDYSPLWRRVRTGNQGKNLESGTQAETWRCAAY